MGKPVRVGLVGSQFISTIHAESLRTVPGAELFAVASPTEGHAQGFAEKSSIPHAVTDYRKLLEMDEIDIVVLGVPNDLLHHLRRNLQLRLPARVRSFRRLH